MDKVSNVVKKIDGVIEKHPLLLALGLNFLLFGLTYFFFTPHFKTNDDIAMMLRAAGVSKVVAPSEYLLFTNVIIGWILKQLYTLHLDTPWYALYLVSSLLVSHIVLLYVALKNRASLLTVLLYLVYFFLVGLTLLLNLQFTIVASIVGLAGIALCLAPNPALKKLEKWDWKPFFRPQYLVAITLMVLSCMIRWRAFVLMVAMFLPIIVLHFYKKPLRIIVFKTVALGIGIFLSFAAYQFNSYVYKKDPAWATYQEHKLQAMQIVNNELMRYMTPAEREKIYTSVGWSINDVRMFMDWFFMDKEVYSLEKINLFLNSLPARKKVPIDTAFELLFKIIGSPFAMGCWVLAVLFFIALPFSWQNLLKLLAGIGGIITMILYLIYYIKTPPERVYFSMMSFIALLPLVVMNVKQEASKFPKLQIAVKIIGLVLLGYCLVLAVENVEEHKKTATIYKKNNRWLHKQIKNLQPNDDQLFVVWAQSMPWQFITPFDNVRFLKKFNTFGLGTGQHSPANKKMLDKYKIDNLYTAFLEKENVYMLLSKRLLNKLATKYKTYMLEHYQRDIEFYLYKENSVFGIYQIR